MKLTVRPLASCSLGETEKAIGLGGLLFLINVLFDSYLYLYLAVYCADIPLVSSF